MKTKTETPRTVDWTSIRQELVLTLLAVFAFSLLVNLFVLAIPIYSLQIFDRVTISQSRETLTMLFFAVGICLIAMMGFEVLRRKMLRLTANGISRSLTRFSLDQQGSMSSKDIELKCNHVNSKTTKFGFSALKRTIKNLRSSVLLVLTDALLTPVFIALLFLLHPVFAIVTTLINLALMAICHYQFSTIRRHSSAMTCETESALKWLASDYQSHWARGREHRLIDEVQSKIEENQRILDRRNAVQSRLTLLILAIRNFGQIAIPTVGAILLIEQQISPGIMLAAMILSMKGLVPWEQVFHNSETLHELFEDLKSLKLNSQNLVTHRASRHAPITDLSGTISIAIESQPTPLELTLASASLTAIIGPSGSGKSSLLKALIGLPNQTDVNITTRYDEHIIGTLERSYLTGRLAYVPCASAVPHLSVRELMCEDNNDNHEELYDISRLLGLHKRVLKLPYGYDTMIDENSVTRSAGVLHLILLARALLSKPQFLFIDNIDATFDKHGVECFEKALVWLKKNGVSTIITTQRKALLGFCENVLLCDQDQIFHFAQNDGIGSNKSLPLSYESIRGASHENSV